MRGKTKRAADRVKGVAARTRSSLSREPIDDVLLHDHIRARLGRLVQHPHDVEVHVHDGRVGPGFMRIDTFALSHDGQHVAFAGYSPDGRKTLVVDEFAGPTFDEILTITGDCPQAIQFRSDGSLDCLVVADKRLSRIVMPAEVIAGLGGGDHPSILHTDADDIAGGIVRRVVHAFADHKIGRLVAGHAKVLHDAGEVAFDDLVTDRHALDLDLEKLAVDQAGCQLTQYLVAMVLPYLEGRRNIKVIQPGKVLQRLRMVEEML